MSITDIEQLSINKFALSVWYLTVKTQLKDREIVMTRLCLKISTVAKLMTMAHYG